MTRPHGPAGRPLRIALVDPSRYAPNYDEALAIPMIERGHQVELHARPPRPGEPDFTVSMPQGLEFYRWSERLAVRGSRRAGQLLKIVEHAWDLIRLERRLRRDKTDVVHVQWLVVPLFDGMFMRWSRRRRLTVTTVHNSNPVHGAAKWSPQRFAMTWAQRAAHRLVAHTPFTSDQLQGRGIPADRISVIPIGLLGGTSERTSDAPAAVEPGADPAEVTLLAFGRLRPYKALDLVLDAMSDLDPELLDRIRLHVAGSPLMDTEPLRAQARSLGIDHRITWDLRFLSEAEVDEAFERASVVLLPYRDVDGSAVLTVSRQHGVPVIATRVGGFTNMIADEVSGLLIEVDDRAGLTKAIERLATDSELREQLAAGATQSAADLPSWDEISEATLSMFDDGLRAEQLAGAHG